MISAMISPEIASRVVHGSPAGYEHGCNSRGGCPNHNHPSLMTCVEAHTAARSDWTIAKQPRDEPVVRALHQVSEAPSMTSRPPRKRAVSQRPLTSIKHGTVHGFNIGCKSIEACPNHTIGEATCTDEHRRYYR